MKLSIVIVNYNVEFFLEQCLNSVYKALAGIDAEVFVVDNNSVDGSVQMVKTRFPEVTLIENKQNTGFSVANNQAIRLSRGEYVLLLNPDTLVQEDTFRKVIGFMDSHPDAGGLGVKMIDGKGNFLPESKRGLPTPEVAFYKIFGLSAFFPRSKRFGRYHLGFLDKEETHSIDVLSGAFMLLRQSVLKETGLLDETFFMYGEDIDLSYRITQAGYRNYYFSDTQIIHYKGESTRKGSLNYVFVFYKAMVIFAKKHFSAKHASLFSFFINLAIWFRASLAVLYRFARIAWLPLLDFAGITFGLHQVANFYENYSLKILDPEILKYAFPAFSITWITVFFFSSVYDRPFRYLKIFKAAFYALLLSLVIYSLLPEDLRFSRAMVILGSTYATAWFLLSRFALKALKVSFYGKARLKVKKFALVGDQEECTRIENMIRPAYEAKTVFYYVSPGQVSQLNDLVRINTINEIVFSGKDLSAQQIITQMSMVESRDVDYKIAPPESLFIIGSNSIDTQGDYYMVEMSGINSAVNQRNKRLTDLLLSIFLTILLPILVFFQQQKTGFLKNLLLAWIGEITWVGFNREYSQTLATKNIKKGVIPVAGTALPEKNIIKVNILYAKNYAWYKDILIIIKNLPHLGNKAV